MFSGVLATGFFICLASAIWSGGTRGLSGSRSSAPTTVADKSISAALTPKNLEKYRITLPPFVEPIARDQPLIREAADRDIRTQRNPKNGGTIATDFYHCQAIRARLSPRVSGFPSCSKLTTLVSRI